MFLVLQEYLAHKKLPPSVCSPVEKARIEASGGAVGVMKGEPDMRVSGQGRVFIKGSLTVSHSRTRWFTFSLFLPLSLSHTHMLSLTLSLSLSLSLSFTHTHTHSLTHSHTHSLIHPLNSSPTRTPSKSLASLPLSSIALPLQGGGFAGGYLAHKKLPHPSTLQ